MTTPNDPEAVREQYATDRCLRIRQEFEDKFLSPKINFASWVIQSMQWHGDEAVLDAGCGVGVYYTKLTELYPDIDYSGIDLSPGMVEKHPAGDQVTLGDAQKTTFPDDSFDVVMANHMLFHVADIDATLEEFKRVLKPGGVIVASTDGANNMPELQVLLRRAILLLTQSGALRLQPPVQPSSLFALENGASQLSRHFYGVMRYDLPGKFTFDQIEPVIEYLNSSRPMLEPQLPEDVAWNDLTTIMKQQIGHLIDHLGEFTVSKFSGVLMASNNGGFIQEFTQTRNKVGESE